MTPFWHLTTVCCIPMFNPQGRMKEQRILREAAADAALRAAAVSQGQVRSRWHEPSKRDVSRYAA